MFSGPCWEGMGVVFLMGVVDRVMVVGRGGAYMIFFCLACLGE